MRRALSLLVTVVLLSPAFADFASPRSACGSHACCVRGGCSMMQQGSRFARCENDRQAIQHDSAAILTVNVGAAMLLIHAGEGAGAPLRTLAGVTHEIERPPNS